MIDSLNFEQSDKLAFLLVLTLRIAEISVSKLFVLEDFENLDVEMFLLRFLLINSWS